MKGPLAETISVKARSAPCSRQRERKTISLYACHGGKQSLVGSKKHGITFTCSSSNRRQITYMANGGGYATELAPNKPRTPTNPMTRMMQAATTTTSAHPAPFDPARAQAPRRSFSRRRGRSASRIPLAFAPSSPFVQPRYRTGIRPLNTIHHNAWKTAPRTLR